MGVRDCRVEMTSKVTRAGEYCRASAAGWAGFR